MEFTTTPTVLNDAKTYLDREDGESILDLISQVDALSIDLSSSNTDDLENDYGAPSSVAHTIVPGEGFSEGPVTIEGSLGPLRARASTARSQAATALKAFTESVKASLDSRSINDARLNSILTKLESELATTPGGKVLLNVAHVASAGKAQSKIESERDTVDGKAKMRQHVQEVKRAADLIIDATGGAEGDEAKAALISESAGDLHEAWFLDVRPSIAEHFERAEETIAKMLLAQEPKYVAKSKACDDLSARTDKIAAELGPCIEEVRKYLPEESQYKLELGHDSHGRRLSETDHGWERELEKASERARCLFEELQDAISTSENAKKGAEYELSGAQVFIEMRRYGRDGKQEEPDMSADVSLQGSTGTGEPGERKQEDHLRVWLENFEQIRSKADARIGLALQISSKAEPALAQALQLLQKRTGTTIVAPFVEAIEEKEDPSDV